MPRYGDAGSIFWFDVKNHCSFHLINSFEDGDEVRIIYSLFMRILHLEVVHKV